ncbi:hypothetical protein MTsPCn9_20080 [Croceitalea sp. MTPC9]|uniref:HYC_CC_PP family protein n=1 Tax=unclassified Croceitalea TaxID=2632280 RepID=UPI002B3AD3B1|nr:hypothetical protein MTsPCn6_12930 [Croceitalea sp. MTPC6]GMN17072.1 hypothetical protein MTsPCn9_20080 [Croceitalea sp. MTPC9]
MNKVFQKIISGLMALMLLLSTVSWTVDKHLCMGRVIDVAFFTKANDCGMEAAMAVLEDVTIKNHCCDDETFIIEGQDDLKLSFNDFDFEQQVFLTAFTTSFLELHAGSIENIVPNEYYPPPLILKDRVVLHEVFLI